MPVKPIAPPFTLERTTDGRPMLVIAETDPASSLEDLEFAFHDQGTEIFQQNGRLVHLVRHNAVADGKSGIHHRQGALIFAEVTPHLLAEMAMTAGAWMKKDMRKPSATPDPATGKPKMGRWVKTKFPIELARHYIDRGQWNVRVLAGTVEAPTLRRDGSLLSEPGYDSASRLFYDPAGVTFPTVDESPTPDDASAALVALLEPLKDFPFEPRDGEQWGGPTASRSVALSAVLTGLVRTSIATAPAHSIDAPVMGTGKTKIAEIASVVGTGRMPTSFSYGSSQEEFQKRLFSVLYKGDRVAIIDNIEQEVESDEFCTVLTSTEWQSRVLGVSKMATVPTNTLWLLNGNRVTFKGDITDRVVVCNLDARVEDPKARTFDREPVAYAFEHRPVLVHAGLTILYAHALAGFPGAKGLTPSRFPDWDKMVRGAIVWLGEPDPQLTRQRVVTVDPVREAHNALMREWEDAFGLGIRATAQELIERGRVSSEVEAMTYKWGAWGEIFPVQTADALHSALMGAMSATSSSLNSRTLGKYLMKLEGRISAGRVIRAKADSKSASAFWLERA